MKALVCADENIVMKNPTKVSYWKWYYYFCGQI